MATITNVPKTITIKTVLNGYRVEVGCQEVVFESRKRMLKEIGRYLKKPNKVEAEYMLEENAPPVEEYRVEITPQRMRVGTWQDDGINSPSATYDTEVPVTYTYTFAETESVARLRQDAINYLRDTEGHPGSQVLPDDIPARLTEPNGPRRWLFLLAQAADAKRFINPVSYIAHHSNNRFAQLSAAGRRAATDGWKNQWD